MGKRLCTLVAAAALTLAGCGKEKALPITEDTLPSAYPAHIVKGPWTYVPACTPYRDNGETRCNRLNVIEENGKLRVIEAIPTIYTPESAAKRKNPRDVVMRPEVYDALLDLAKAQKEAQEAWPEARDILHPEVQHLVDYDGDGEFDMIAANRALATPKYAAAGRMSNAEHIIPAKAMPALNRLYAAHRTAALKVGKQMYEDLFSKW